MASATTNQKANEARNAAGQAMDKAKEAASAVGEMAGSAASAIGRKADDFTSSAGAGIKHVGDTIRDQGPQSGILGQATRSVADTTKQVGQYLEKEGLSGMFEDMTNLIKRNPVPAILVGVGLGVLIGRVMRS